MKPVHARALQISLIVMASFSSLKAQLNDCPNVISPGFKVLLDDIKPTGTISAQDAAWLREKMQFAFGESLRGAGLDEESRVNLLHCVNRIPGDDSDFTPARMELLDGWAVLLEVWAVASSALDVSGRTLHEAFFHYALVPVRNAPSLLDPPRVYVQPHTIDLGDPQAGLLSLFENSAAELQAYTVIAVGINWAALEDYDRALTFLCKGQGLLAQATAGEPSMPDKALLDYAERLRQEVLRKKAGSDVTLASFLQPATVAFCTEGR